MITTLMGLKVKELMKRVLLKQQTSVQFFANIPRAFSLTKL
jgi:hypothetical protein